MGSEIIIMICVMIFGYAGYTTLANWNRERKQKEERLKYYKARPNNSKKKK